MKIIVNNKEEHAFFIGDKGAVLVPYDGDFVMEYSPSQYSIPDLATVLENAYNTKRFNSGDRQYERLLAYCNVNNIKL